MEKGALSERLLTGAAEVTPGVDTTRPHIPILQLTWGYSSTVRHPPQVQWQRRGPVTGRHMGGRVMREQLLWQHALHRARHAVLAPE